MIVLLSPSHPYPNTQRDWGVEIRGLGGESGLPHSALPEWQAGPPPAKGLPFSSRCRADFASRPPLGLLIDRMAARSDIFDLQCNNIAIPQLAVDREQMVAGYPRTPARVSCIMIKRWHVTPRTPSKCLGPSPLPATAGAHAERHRARVSVRAGGAIGLSCLRFAPNVADEGVEGRREKQTKAGHAQHAKEHGRA